MTNIPPLGGNQPPPPPPGGNQPPPPPPGGNQALPPPGALPPWLAHDVVAVLGQQHPLPKNIERVLPNFIPERGGTIDNHICSFFLALRKLGVTNEDVVCCIFSFTLTGAASTWYFSLRIGSITSWDAFQ